MEKIICNVPDDIRELLDTEAARINNVGFIEKDPVQFPREFSRLEDIEIVALLSAAVAWGNRKMICNDIRKMLALMDNEPYKYVMDKGYEGLNPDLNIHRTMFAGHLAHFLRGLRFIYKKYGSLDEFSNQIGAGSDEAPAWNLVREIQKVLLLENKGEICNRCLPFNFKDSALKRFNMALRWLVRDDGIVDMGVWRSIPKSKLFIPLDVHVGNISRELGLLSRKANDRKSVVELTEVLRSLRPDDPCIYDYALFGIGVEGKSVR
ncbi:MAG: TIGR02757 family protein [Muribaculaceae bacterium]